METQTDPPNPPIDLQTESWRHLVHTIFHLLPPPLTNTPEGRQTRNRAAVARIADLDPVNANEAELAAQCVVARAQAEDIMRLIRVHADDIALVVKLNAQYAAMVRISLAAQNRLLRDQQRRRKREENQHDADTDEWTRHIAASTMLREMPSEPESEPESHAAGSETPTRPPPASNPGWPDDPDGGPLARRCQHDDPRTSASMAQAPPQWQAPVAV